MDGYKRYIVLVLSTIALNVQGMLPGVSWRRLEVLARHCALQGIKASNAIVLQGAGATKAYAEHVSAERIEEKLKEDHRLQESDFELSRYMPLIEAVHEIEQAYPDHYSFVHAHSKNVKSVHDLYKEVMRLNGTPLRADWVPLRVESDLCADHAQEYLKNYDMKKQDNYDLEHQKNLLSVNFSVPGNLYGPESSLRYFAADHSVRIPEDLIKKYFGQIVPHFDEIISHCIEVLCGHLSTLLDSQEGVLVQK